MESSLEKKYESLEGAYSQELNDLIAFLKSQIFN